VLFFNVNAHSLVRQGVKLTYTWHASYLYSVLDAVTLREDFLRLVRQETMRKLLILIHIRLAAALSLKSFLGNNCILKLTRFAV